MHKHDDNILNSFTKNEFPFERLKFASIFFEFNILNCIFSWDWCTSSVHKINSLLNLCNSNQFTFKRDTTSLSTCLKNRIGNTLKHKYELFFQNTIRNNPNSKLRTYIQFKSIYSVEKYLHLIRNPLFRKSFSKLRLSNHKLPIEKGR